MDFTLYILTAFALVFVIEGLIYACFPDGVRKMFAMALAMPAAQLRVFGVFMALIGCILVWLLQRFAGG